MHLPNNGVWHLRLIARPAAVLMLAATLAGCTKTVPPASLPQVAGGVGSGTITWLADPTALTAGNDMRQVLADAFEQAYPSITVNLETGPTSTDAGPDGTLLTWDTDPGQVADRMCSALAGHASEVTPIVPGNGYPPVCP